jgi:hypothetical protein
MIVSTGFNGVMKPGDRVKLTTQFANRQNVDKEI